MAATPNFALIKKIYHYFVKIFKEKQASYNRAIVLTQLILH